MMFPGYNPFAPTRATPPTAAGPIGPSAGHTPKGRHLPAVDQARWLVLKNNE